MTIETASSKSQDREQTEILTVILCAGCSDVSSAGSACVCELSCGARVQTAVEVADEFNATFNVQFAS